MSKVSDLSMSASVPGSDAPRAASAPDEEAPREAVHDEALDSSAPECGRFEAETDSDEPVAIPDPLRQFFASEPAPGHHDGTGRASRPPSEWLSIRPPSTVPPSRRRLVPLPEGHPAAASDRRSGAPASERGRAASSPAPLSTNLDLPSADVAPPASVPEAPASEGPAPVPPSSEPFVSEPTSSIPPFSAPEPASTAPLSSPEPVLEIRPANASAVRELSPRPQGPRRPTHTARTGPERLEPARRRRRPWLLLAAAGLIAFRMCADEPESSEAPAPLAAARRSASNAAFTFDFDGPFTASSLGSATALLNTKASGNAAAPMLLERNARKPALTSPQPKPEAEQVAKALQAFELTARPVVPGRTWQESANASDWPAVALAIDALSAAEKADPGARYARALAGRELGQCDVALSVLDGLESELPLLVPEIAELRAQCQLEVGPYEAAYQYFSEEQTPDKLTLAARAAQKGGDLAKAERTIEKALSKIRRQDGRRALEREIAARMVRANILEQRGQPKAAARDWLWLATEVATEAACATADDTYERLAGARLGSTQRLERLRAFAREGQLDRTLREYARLSSAPGPLPERVEVTSALAWAYYHSRTDYAKARELFHEAASLSADTRVKFLFYEGRALERANENELALATYRELVRRYPGGPYTEQAHYRLARIEYGRGNWEGAERAYTDYLERYARGGGGKYASASRYELAIARIGAKERTDDAAQTLGQLAKRERRASRRAALTELEAVALELTHEPARVRAAIAKYRSVIDEFPLSFAARASVARLRALGDVDGLNARAELPRHDPLLADPLRLPEKAQLLANIGLHTDAERAVFDARQAARERYVGGEGQALCEMYGALDRGFRSYALAERLLKRDALGRLPSSDNLWAWRCKYPEPYRDIVNAVEARYHLPPSLVHAVMRQESGFRQNVVSPAGAIGLMQLMPNTAIKAAEEIMQQPGAPWVPDPRRPTNVLNNLELGGYYLSKLLNMLGGQMPVAVAAYNAGPGAVSSWLAGGEDLPVDVWVARIPYTETRDYVSIVMGNWLAYRYLDDPTELPELKLALVPGVRAPADAY